MPDSVLSSDASGQMTNTLRSREITISVLDACGLEPGADACVYYWCILSEKRGVPPDDGNLDTSAGSAGGDTHLCQPGDSLARSLCHPACPGWCAAQPGPGSS